MEKKLYDKIDSSLLKSLPNPSPEAYEAKIKIPAMTVPKFTAGKALKEAVR